MAENAPPPRKTAERRRFPTVEQLAHAPQVLAAVGARDIHLRPAIADRLELSWTEGPPLGEGLQMLGDPLLRRSSTWREPVERQSLRWSPPILEQVTTGVRQVLVTRTRDVLRCSIAWQRLLIQAGVTAAPPTELTGRAQRGEDEPGAPGPSASGRPRPTFDPAPFQQGASVVPWHHDVRTADLDAIYHSLTMWRDDPRGDRARDAFLAVLEAVAPDPAEPESWGTRDERLALSERLRVGVEHWFQLSGPQEGWVMQLLRHPGMRNSVTRRLMKACLQHADESLRLEGLRLIGATSV